MRAMALGYGVTAVASLALLAAAWRRPRLGRWLFAALFLGASAVNAVTALRTPQVYVTGFAPHAVGPFRDFIERIVALAPDAFVLAIALLQLLVGLALLLARGVPFQVAVFAGATFLAGISWLGVGAGFPVNLVFAAGLLVLLKGDRAPPAARR